MTETTQTTGGGFRLNGAWVTCLVILAALAVFDFNQLWPAIQFTFAAITHTGIFIVFAVLAVAYLKATGAENLLAKAFEGNQSYMIIMAAFLGGLSPFCSCEVIPFIAALLAVGAPLGAVMAFWLASPLMDPAMYAITSGTLGFEFATAKALAAIGIGMFGGFVTMALSTTAVFVNPLKPQNQSGCGSCCSASKPFSGQPEWTFWQDSNRTQVFKNTMIENALFLLKWLTLAYLVEALMLHYIPATLISQYLGGTGIGTVILGAFIGMPAYLNGYAAIPLVDAMLQQGMAQGAAMSFMLAGGVSCIPAAIAVWALVKPRVFAAYLGLALTGSVVAGLVWQVMA